MPILSHNRVFLDMVLWVFTDCLQTPSYYELESCWPIWMCLWPSAPPSTGINKFHFCNQVRGLLALNNLLPSSKDLSKCRWKELCSGCDLWKKCVCGCVWVDVGDNQSIKISLYSVGRCDYSDPQKRNHWHRSMGTWLLGLGSGSGITTVLVPPIQPRF